MLLILLALTEPVLQAPAPARARTALARVDWANRSYGRHLHLRNGRYVYRRYPARHTAWARLCRHSSYSAKLLRVHYQDLTGDAKPEAIVEIDSYQKDCGGPAYMRRMIIAFTKRAGRITELGRFAPLFVHSVRVHQGAIHIVRTEYGRKHRLACKDVWRLVGGKLKIIKASCTPVP